MMEPFRYRIVALIVQHTKFIFAFIYLTEFSRPFCLKHSPHKESVFPLNSSNDTLIVFHPICELITMAGQMQNILWGREVME